MAEHHAHNLSRQQLCNDRRGGRVREMAMTRLDALFYRPGSLRIVLQKFLVVIRLNDERLHLAQPLDCKAGGMTEIGNVAKRGRARQEGLTDPVDPHQRDGKIL